MRLLNSNFEFCDFDDTPPPYAILSHTWSENNEEEVTYQDLKDGTTKSKLKLELCRGWANAAGYKYFWIDTCCIDKRNDAELVCAIRSMWRWYRKAAVCFVYLPDFPKKRKLNTDADWRDALKDCRWFTRGWTLQELVASMASKKVEFYAGDGHLGSLQDLLLALKSITGISLGNTLPDHATRLGWVAERVTKRPEDRAYCMLGICDVSLDARYGEGGESAWRRLQDAIAHRHGTVALEIRIAATAEDHRARVLKDLRFDGLETRRETVKVAIANTCEWILDHPACAKWLELEHKFFWIKGKPGAGKSVLIRYLDQHITQRLWKSHAIGLYFYFNARGGQLEKSFLGLYRSMLVQLVDLAPALACELDALKMHFDLQQLQRVLASAILGLGRQIWLFIDALDECREGDVRELIDFLDGLRKAKLYVCFSSRHYPTVKVPTHLQLVLEEVDEHNEDMSTYVEKLDLEGEELAQMQRDIVAKANGIFLWVVLVVAILQKDVERARFHAMKSRLREIPEGLPELFKSIILRDAEHKEEFLLCLRWILYARRPLTLKEWYFAMMAGVNGHLEWVEGVTDHRMETFLLSSSKGLAELTTGLTVTTQFIHESVRDYLIHQGGFEEICSEQKSPASISHEQLKQCCLRGMMSDLEQSHRNPFADYATTHILHHADQAAVTICQQHFLAHEFSISNWVTQFNAFNFQSNKYTDAPSLSYLCAERGLARLPARPTGALLPEKHQRYRTPLTAAIVCSSWEVLRVFLNDMDVPNIEETITEIRSRGTYVLWPKDLPNDPWRWAVRNGLGHLSKHLLKSVPVKEFSFPVGSPDALHAASERGDENIVRILLDLGVDVNTSGRELGNALQAASNNGYEEIVKMLIDAGADVNRGELRSTPLDVASVSDHVKIVRMLIDAGADVNAQGEGNRTALYKASEKGNNEVVQTLLEAGADVNAEQEGGNALQTAAFEGHEKIVQMLICAGADVNTQGGYHGNALYAASSSGHWRIAYVLIAVGADVHARGGLHGNALRAAIEGGHEETMQVLIRAGAVDQWI
jgi:ankyrin repeat protein